MANSQMNNNLNIAIDRMKKDIVKNGGSCMFVIVNDGEVLENGGGNADQMQMILRLAVETIENDRNGIIRTN